MKLQAIYDVYKFDVVLGFLMIINYQIAKNAYKVAVVNVLSYM